MGMTINEAIRYFKDMKKACCCGTEQADIAIDTMRKYQKIEQIVEHWACCGNPSDSMIAISEVIEDGKID